MSKEVRSEHDEHTLNGEVTRSCVLCPGSVLNEVKTEHNEYTYSISVIVMRADSSNNVDSNLTDIHEMLMNVKLCLKYTGDLYNTVEI